MEPEDIGHGLAHGNPGIKGEVRILENDLYVLGQKLALPGLQSTVSPGPAANFQLPGVGRFKGNDHTSQG